MRIITHVLMLFLSLAYVGWAEADMANTCADATSLPAEGVFTELIDSKTDRDWFYVDVPVGQRLDIALYPKTQLDVGFTLSLGCNQAAEYDEDDWPVGIYENSSWGNLTNAQQRVYIQVYEYLGGASISPAEYEIRLQLIPVGAPVTRMPGIKRQYDVGDKFEINLQVFNITTQTIQTDIFLVMEFSGFFYFYPSWNSTGDGIMNTSVLSGFPYSIFQILQFSVPPTFPVVDGFNFYAAAMNRQTGVFGNICYAPVGFGTSN